MDDDTEILTFEPWPDADIDGYGQHPEGTYSRLAWLPVVGPSSWLVWGTLATQLRRDAVVHWELVALAEAHGLHRGAGRWGMVRRTLTRLDQYGLVASGDVDGSFFVRLSAPPVPARWVGRLPAAVRALHVHTFSVPHRWVGRRGGSVRVGEARADPPATSPSRSVRASGPVLARRP